MTQIYGFSILVIVSIAYACLGEYVFYGEQADFIALLFLAVNDFEASLRST